MVAVVAGCTTRVSEERLPGIYQFERRSGVFRHGTDLLILHPDHSYLHIYAPLTTEILQTQRGRWSFNEDGTLTAYQFLAWDLDDWGPRKSEEELHNPPPANVGMPVRIGNKGRLELLLNPDEDDHFVQLR